MFQILSNAVNNSPLKYNVKLEATYIIPNTDIKENRAFKTYARCLYKVDNINYSLELDFLKIFQEKEEMEHKGSGFSLDSIDGIIMNVSVYKPLGGSSYIPLTEFIENKKATINVWNNDDECFKYSVLVKHVNSAHPERLTHYIGIQNMYSYDFSNLNFPTTLNDIKKIEKKNEASVNVYSIKQGEPIYKNNVKKNFVESKFNKYIIYPLKVCDDELNDHHDLLLFDNGNDRQYYCCISNLAKLVGAKISRHGYTTLLCKWCFKSYLGISRWGVTAKQWLKDHKINCNKNKPIVPLLPNPNTFIKFEN
jgi:hypothetical protein